ncbi:MAG: DUF2493 domain-containing protein [Propionibacteriaceae bacterium]|nr:MAG: DUF2493 domain-containing protein [Propionibacteriaceae bacterium]
MVPRGAMSDDAPAEMITAGAFVSSVVLTQDRLQLVLLQDGLVAGLEHPLQHPAEIVEGLPCRLDVADGPPLGSLIARALVVGLVDDVLDLGVEALGSGVAALEDAVVPAHPAGPYRYGDPMDTAYRILVTGSRHATVAQHGIFIEETLAVARNKHPVTLVHGGAPGVDLICGAIAHSFGWDVKVFRADWDKLGKAAGPERNKEMVNAGADVVLAFPIAGGLNKGTKHCSNYAEIMGLTVRYFELAARI